MPIFGADDTDAHEDLWDAGLARLIDAHADDSIIVDGLDTPIVGMLAYVARDGWLVNDQREDGAPVGTIVVVPVDRAISVRAAYRLGAAVERR